MQLLQKRTQAILALTIFGLIGVLVVSCGKPAPRGRVVTQRTTTAPPTKCVRVYYNQSTGESLDGRLQAIVLENLLAHFKNVQQFLSPVEKYRAGDIDGPLAGFASCAATLFLGTTADAEMPKAFLKEAAATKNQFAWLGSNVDLWGAKNLRKTLNVAFDKVVAKDKNQPDAAGAPGFYRNYTYKGEVFQKGIEWDSADKKIMSAADEVAQVTLLDPRETGNVLSWAEHSGEPTPNKPKPQPIPYAIHRNNFWLVTDSPFSYVNNADRYLIVADLLFDILQEPALYPGPRPAFVRYEDIHAELPAWQLNVFLGMMVRNSVNFAMSVIPEYADERKNKDGSPKNYRVKASERPDFLEWVNQAIEVGGTLVMHGWTHQSDDIPNPLGVSGWDYEFWDFNTDGPMPNDSKMRTLDRLEKGYAIFDDANLTPSAWLTPHYMASPLDNFVFGQVFEWSIGGVQVSPYSMTGTPIRKEANFDASGVKGRDERRATLSKMHFRAGKTNEGFRSPFEIYGDTFGQGVVPETAGYINPNVKASDYTTVNDILATLKRNRVIRDAWGSYFFHPFMLNPPAGGGIAKYEGDVEEIERLLRETKKLGYEFVDFKNWILKQGAQKRSATIEVVEEEIQKEIPYF